MVCALREMKYKKWWNEFMRYR